MNLSDAVDRLVRIGPVEAMREDERAAGNAIILPGMVDWLPALDWPEDIVVATRGRFVRIIAIKAKHPGTGAFSRMITGIAVAGRIPIIVEPMFDMPDILKRWGWSRRIVGSGFEKEEQWQPSRAWLAARAAVNIHQRSAK